MRHCFVGVGRVGVTMWQSTKKLVRQLIEQNNKDFVLLNEKYEEIIKEKKEADIKTENLIDLVSTLMQNQTIFIANVNQVINAIRETVVKIDDNVEVLSEKLNDVKNDLKKDTDGLHVMGESVKKQCEQLSREIKENDEKERVLMLETENKLLQTFEKQAVIIKETVNDNNQSVVNKLERIEKQVNDDSERKILDEVNASLVTMKEENDIFMHDVYTNERAVTDNLGIVNRAVQQLITNTAQLDEANRLLIAKTLLKDMEI